MPRYLVMAKWNAAGAAASRSEGFARREESTRAVWESVGGTVELSYFGLATSEWDLVAVVNNVNSDSIWAVGNLVMGSGTVERVGAMELRTGAEADAAAAVQIQYRPAGQT